jgi:PAS domain S-box-containing protein
MAWRRCLVSKDRPGQDRTGTIKRDAARIVLIAFAYFGAHEVSFLFPDPPGVLAAVWPPAGIGLAALLLSPRRLWPWIIPALFVAGNSANLLSGRPPFNSIGFMTANVLESLACAWLISRWSGEDVRFVRVKDVTALLVAGTLVNACTSFIGAGTAALASHAPFWSFWLTWWIANGLGILMVTPLIVTWVNMGAFFSGVRKSKVLESALFMASLIAGAWLMSYGRGSETHSPLTPTPYMLVGLFAWAALRLGPAVVTLGLFTLAVVAVAGKAAGVGPLPWGAVDPTQRLLIVQVYLGFVTGVALLLGASHNETRSAEESSREEHARLRALGDNLPNGIVYQVLQEHDGTMRFQYVSAGFECLNGVSGEDVLKDSGALYRLIVDEDRALKMAAGEASAKAMTPLHVQFRIRRPDGETSWMQLSAAPRRLEDGRILWDGIQMDITEQKLAEDAVRQSEANFSSFFNASLDFLFVVDMEGKVILANKTAIDRLGYSGEEIAGKPVLMLHPVERRAEAEKFLQDILEGRESRCPVPLLTKDERQIPVETRVVRGMWDDREVLFGISKDISDLRRSEERFSKAFHNNTAAMVLSTYAEGRFVDVNEPFLAVLGYSRDEVIGRTSRELDIFVHTAQRDVVRRETMEEGIVKNVELSIKGKGGRVIVGLFSATPIYILDELHLLTTMNDITERKHLENSLTEQLLFLGTLIDTIPNPVFYKDAEGKYLGCNRAFEAYYGTTRDWLRGKTVRDLLPHECADNNIKIDTDLIGTRGSISYEATFQHPDGTIRNLINNKAVFPKPDGSAGGIVGIIMDVTAQKRAEEALKLSESNHRSLSTMMRLMCDNVPDMIWAKDIEKRYIFANKAICRGLLNAVDTDEPVGKTDIFFAERERALHPDHPEWHTFGEICVDSDVLTLETGAPSRFDEYGNVQGKFLFLDVHKAPFIDEKGQVIGTVGSGRDVTVQKQAEKALQESEEKYRHVFAAESDALFLVDKETGAILDANDAACSLYGYGREELLRLKNMDMSAQPEETEKLTRKPVSRVFDRLHKKKDGTRFYVDISSSLFFFHGREVILAAVRDITSRKQMEAELFKARNLESIGVLAAGIAHDFNNLLTVVVGNIAVALMDLSSDGGMYQVLEQAEQAALGGKELTQRLITFARGGFFMKEIMVPNQLVKDLCATALAGSGVRCEYDLADNLFPVIADDGQIRQVIGNILFNAKEAMPAEGVIRVETTNVSHTAENMLIPLSAGNYVRITIEDEGRGIGAEDLPKIFDPYFTTKGMGSDKGMGLGLTVAYSIVKRHKGHIEVDSVLGRGTTVHVYLPAYTEDVEAAEMKETTGSVEGKVLFMDDEESVRTMTGRLLTRLGYEVVVTGDGVETIAVYERALFSDKPFDVVILDLTMKQGIGGRETMGRLLSVDSKVKAIISSGYADDPVMTNHADYGFKAAVVKPYKVEELKEVLQKIVSIPAWISTIR